MSKCCDCTPVGETSCYLPGSPSPALLHFGTGPQLESERTQSFGGADAVLVDTQNLGNSRVRRRYEIPEDWGFLPGLSGEVVATSRTTSPTGADATPDALRLGGLGCGTFRVRFSRPLYVAFLPLIDYDNRSEQTYYVDPPFIGGVRRFRASLPFSGTNPSPTQGGNSFTVQPDVLYGGNQPRECLPNPTNTTQTLGTGSAFSTANRTLGQDEQGALFFGYRRTRQVTWTTALPQGLGVQFPWLSVLDDDPVRHARQQICPQPNGTVTSEWRDSITNAVLTPAQLATLGDCP